ncbi:hypothetical protein ACWCQL_21585 [Streptomyces sp. NPDC002073]|uniref:hypothetical protein n=1 Tax=Streptomyces sp. NBC_00239 TaxID=2903640 RepID=UPI002E2B38B5|nr:hypothetical protein [Streptomyces sp. NBC_00239]
MHTPAVPAPAAPAPDPAGHTRTRPVHWLTTALAVAAVVTGAGLLEPDAGPAAPDGTKNLQAPDVPVPDPAAVAYPLDCRGLEQAVTASAAGDLDGDGRPETVAAVRCAAGSGTPPSGIYVLTGSPAGRPRVVATLLDPADRLNATALSVREGTVTATLLGYSAADVPRCCPDTRSTTKWHWDGGKFLRYTTAAKSV